MKFALALMLSLQDETPYNHKEFGLELMIPKGWTVDSTRSPNVLLKIYHQADAASIQINDLRPPEPLTLGQQRERLRSVIQVSIKESKIIDERAVAIGDFPGAVFTVESKGEKDADMISFNGIWFLSPKRFIGIDAVAAREKGEALKSAVDRLIATIKRTPRPTIPIEGPAKEWAKLPAPASMDAKTEVELALGDKVIGAYSVSVKSVEGGYELRHSHRVDYGADGMEVSNISGFLSADLSRQSVKTQLHRTTRDKRSIYVTAEAELKDGKLAVKRRVNGELVESTFAVPSGTVLADLLEAAHLSLIELGKGLSAFPVLNVFDHEPNSVQVESLGPQKVKLDGETIEIYSISVAQDSRVLTYWYGADRRIVRITGFGAGVVARRKK